MKRLLVALVAVALAVAGCGAGDGDASGRRTLTVLAASSLSGTFADLAVEFEDEHPGVDVRLVLDSSATLARQAIEGAPGDVLATADRTTMSQAVEQDGLDGDPTEFATNVLLLAVPRTITSTGSGARIRSLHDLDADGVDYLTCVPTAPCGAAARKLLQDAGVTRNPASEEIDVKAVLAKVADGEADAGLVYRTDVIASHGLVSGIEIPQASVSPNTYWIGETADAADDDLAQAWISFVTGTKGRAVLTAAGFGVPRRD